MCGITGVFKFDQDAVPSNLLQRMTAILAHRGPDGEGIWLNPNQSMGLGHRRLAVLDLSQNGRQPMHYNGRYTITFNGEIYNYIELREDLIGKGYRFYSDSDTEVLLAAYQEYEEKVLSRLDGMFAFAIWDEQEKRLFCARDRFGEKPFFYHYLPGKYFAFASEIKGLFAYGVPLRINYRMLHYYLAYDVVEDLYDKRETFYEGVQRLEAAHYLIVTASGDLKTRRYWCLPDNKTNGISDFEKVGEQFRDLFYQSIRRRLRSDVSIGTSLSGGLDSSSIVCVVADLLKNVTGQPPRTFSALFDVEEFNEDKYINKIVAATNARSYFTRLDSSTLLDEIDSVFYHQEEPFGTASIVAQWEVMKLASQKKVTVLLDGQGADEILGGYLHFFRPLFMQLYRNNRTQLAQEVKAYTSLREEPFPIDARFKMEAINPRALRLFGWLRRRWLKPAYLEHLHPDFAWQYRKEPPPFKVFSDLNQALRFATGVYGLEKLLRFSDRNSMAFSREVRLPFLSHELVEFLFRLPDSFKISQGWTKRILRMSMKDILPSEIAWRVDKQGFEAPQDKWLRQSALGKLVGSCREQLAAENIFRSADAGNDWQVLMTSRLLGFGRNFAGENSLQ